MIFMNKKKYIYNIKDIMQIMGIGKNSAYKLVQSGEIPYKLIGNRYKIPAIAFHNWLNKINNEKPLQNEGNCDIMEIVTNGEQTLPVQFERSN